MNGARLTIEAVDLTFGGLAALTAVNLRVEPGERVGLIGPNGAGKTSLINVVTGFYRPQRGHVAVDEMPLDALRPASRAALGVARTFQHSEAIASMGARDLMLLGRHRDLPAGVLRYALGPLSRRTARAEREAATHVAGVAEGLGVAEAVKANTPLGDLPYGVRKLVDLGRALAAEARVLLVDEPGAGLSADEKQRIAAVLVSPERAGLTQVIVDHDVAFVTSVAQRLVVLDAGRVIADGPPDTVLAEPAVIDAYLGLGPREFEAAR